MKISVGELKKTIKEMVIEEEIRLAQDSLDDQIDSIILRFETDAIVDQPGSSDEEPPMPEGLVDLGQLLEAPEDEEEEDPAPEDEEADEEPSADEDEPADEEGGEEDTAPPEGDDALPDEEAQPLAPNIDTSRFATDVARLAQKYQNLLDVPMVIVTRAYNHLAANYDESVAQEFADKMEAEYGLSIEKPDISEPRELPIAVGAGASGLGGA